MKKMASHDALSYVEDYSTAESKAAGMVKELNISRMDDGTFHVVASTDKGHSQSTTHPTHHHLLAAVKDYVMSPHLMRLVGGGRFSVLKDKLANQPGIRNPGALAAYIGRRKYGAKRFDALAHG